MSVREALRLALDEELERDDRVYLLGEEVGLFDGAYRVTAGLMDKYGEDRVRDPPISEEGFVGAAIGAAIAGGRPVVEIMTVNFNLLAMVVRAQQAADELDASAEVIDLRSLRPLDFDTVAKSVAKTGRALRVEEGWATYGVSAELAARMVAARSRARSARSRPLR